MDLPVQLQGFSRPAPAAHAIAVSTVLPSLHKSIEKQAPLVTAILVVHVEQSSLLVEKKARTQLDTRLLNCTLIDQHRLFFCDPHHVHYTRPALLRGKVALLDMRSLPGLPAVDLMRWPAAAS